ncbi:MAG: adenylate kinase [Pseudonocardiaceae bacterium]
MPDRILVYGVTGSGKSTLAARIAERTGLPWYALDDLMWEPGWIAAPPQEQRRRVEAICASERWILDTAYLQWIDVPLARVELIIGLDYPRWLSFSRLVRRTLSRVISLSPVCNGNIESLRLMLSRDSILLWQWHSFARKRNRIRLWATDPFGPAVVHLTSPGATRRWLATLP